MNGAVAIASNKASTATAREFLSLLFPRDIPDGAALEIRTLWPGEKAPRQQFFNSIADVTLDASEGSRTWFGPGLRRRGSRTGKAEDVVLVSTLWADIEKVEDPKALLVRVRRILPPTFAVSSGTGVHLYWRFETPLNVTSESATLYVREAIHGLAHALGGDTSVHDLSRVMGLAGTMNGKYSPPRSVELIYKDLMCTYQIGNDLERFRKPFAVRATSASVLDGSPLPPPSEPDPEWGREVLGIDAELRELIRTGETGKYQGDRSKRDYAIEAALIRAGESLQTIVDVFHDNPVGDRAREKPAQFAAEVMKLWNEHEVTYAAAVAARDMIEAGRTDEEILAAVQISPEQVRKVHDDVARCRHSKEMPAEAAVPIPPLAEILDAVEAFLKRFIVFSSPHQSAALALWAAHTHAIDAADFTPYPIISAPAKRSGKSRVLEVLSLLVARPQMMSIPSEAVLFRMIHANAPTVLLDEVDTIFKDTGEKHEGVRAVLNSGYRRGNTVPRCVGESHKIEHFNVFGAKALAGIGEVPDTVSDRGIPIVLARQLRTEKRSRFRLSGPNRVQVAAKPIFDALAAWAKTAIEPLRAAEPVLPDEIHDRAQDVMEPLFAIADLAGSGWETRARAAAVALIGSRGDSKGEEIELLEAIRRAFILFGRGDKTVNMSTKNLLSRVLEEHHVERWARAVKHDNLRGAAMMFAREVKKWGIAPSVVTCGVLREKGYSFLDFQDIFARYLGPDPSAELLAEAALTEVSSNESASDGFGGREV